MKKEKRRLLLTVSLIASSLAVATPAFSEGEVVFSLGADHSRMRYVQPC